MKKILITEHQDKQITDALLSEEVKKVSRQDFSRTQFKIEELQNSLNETLKDYRKLHASLPTGLQGVTKSKFISIGTYLGNAQGEINKLKEGIINYKRKIYYRQTPPTPEDPQV